VQWGPIDGTSAVSHKIDEVFGPDRPGRAYVSPSGDEGNLPNHAGADYDNTQDTVVRFTKAQNALSYLPIWYTGSQPAQVTLMFDDGTTVGPVGPGGFLNQNGVYIQQYEPGQEFYPWRSTSGDRAVYINIAGRTGGGSVRIRGTTPGAGHADFYGEDGLANFFRFTDHLVPGRLTDYSATQSAIGAPHGRRPPRRLPRHSPRPPAVGRSHGRRPRFRWEWVAVACDGRGMIGLRPLRLPPRRAARFIPARTCPAARSWEARLRHHQAHPVHAGRPGVVLDLHHDAVRHVGVMLEQQLVVAGPAPRAPP